jgi:Na+/H+ antiporter NhaA
MNICTYIYIYMYIYIYVGYPFGLGHTLTAGWLVGGMYILLIMKYLHIRALHMHMHSVYVWVNEHIYGLHASICGCIKQMIN